MDNKIFNGLNGNFRCAQLCILGNLNFKTET